MEEVPQPLGWPDRRTSGVLEWLLFPGDKSLITVKWKAHFRAHGESLAGAINSHVVKVGG